MRGPGINTSGGRGARSCRAFTLVEILLALALAGLVSALLAPELGAIYRTLERADPDRVLWDGVTAARARALEMQRTVWLRCDPQQRRLISDAAAAPAGAWPDGVAFRLLPPLRGAAVLLGGRRVETTEISAVRFYPDGTCDAFRAEIRGAGAAPRILAVDPWTCAPIIAAEVRR